MEIIQDPKEMQQLCASWRCGRETIGYVPTMGALHAGHLELCRRAREENSRFVASIFVNPAQFGPNEDLAKYPRPFDKDIDLLREAGCDAVFTPTPEHMYGTGTDFLHGTWIDVTPFDEMWEGVTRPGHMRGVATVVAKLFNIMCPARTYFGEKDYQQLVVVQAMVRDLNFGLEVVPVPTVRESDGLALSSRNAYLSPEDRQAAATLYRAMCAGADLASRGERDVAALGARMQAVFEAEPRVKPQYVAIVDAQTLAPLQTLDAKRPARIIVAAYVGRTRLIDNLALPIP
jgi:pantoate--beta-alanine ligase